jgi:nitrogen-specific signal transduction histidine kinase
MDETPLRIMIQNKGAVPAEIRERFFDKFVTSGKQGGTGLGTYSAKMLAEAQSRLAIKH